MIDLVTFVTDNLLLLVGLGAVIVVVAVIASTYSRLHAARHRVRMAELMIEQTKLQMVQRRELMREYTQAAVVLDDGERARLDAISEDIATLSRRAIALMSEVDARTSRLERGVEIAKMNHQLDTIRQNESKLFAPQGHPAH